MAISYHCIDCGQSCTWHRSGLKSDGFCTQPPRTSGSEPIGDQACSRCTARFGSLWDLSSHIVELERHGSPISSTTVGATTTPKQKGLASIPNLHSPGQNPSHRCNGCGKTFTHANRLSSHRGDAPNTAERFACDAKGCRFTSCSASGLRNHREGPKHCSPSHIKAAMPIPLSPGPQKKISSTVSCDQCTKGLWIPNLKRHVAEYHSVISCATCSSQDQRQGPKHIRPPPTEVVDPKYLTATNYGHLYCNKCIVSRLKKRKV